MRVSRPFLRLPIRFCEQTLAEEVRRLPPSAWTPHPQGYEGNDAVALVSPGGQLSDDIAGAMAPTEYLRGSPYIMGLMAELGGAWGRSRLMGLGPGSEVPLHVDVHYYWRTHLRIHIPIVTNPDVKFTCGDETVHMAPGECWVFDSFQPHRVENAGSDKRTHLVLDTVGGERLWDLVDAAGEGSAPPPEPWLPAKNADPLGQLTFERVNVPAVMSPWEIRCHVDYIAGHVIPNPALEPVLRQLDRFITAWQSAWSRFGTADEGLPTYRALINRLRSQLETLGAGEIMLRNNQTFAYTLEAMVFWNAIARDPASVAAAVRTETRPDAAASSSSAEAPVSYRERIERPIFVVSTPRSGSTLLFETLAQAPGLYSAGNESHGIIEGIQALSVPAHGFESNRLTAEDARPEASEVLAKTFYLALHDRDGTQPSGAIRMLEKTPKNALRVPFFDAIWPDADFVFLYRDPRQTLSSMIEAWLSGGFRTYPGLPGWQGHPWSLLLVPGWQQLSGKPLPFVVAQQWATTIDVLIDDLSKLPKERVRTVVYDDLIDSPQSTIEALVHSLDLAWDRSLGAQLPLSKTTVSRPARDKWHQIKDVIESMLPIIEKADARARAFVESRQMASARAA